MTTSQKKTAMQLQDGSIPVNAHTKVETVVVFDSTKGLSLQAILDDLETRVALNDLKT